MTNVAPVAPISGIYLPNNIWIGAARATAVNLTYEFMTQPPTPTAPDPGEDNGWAPMTAAEKFVFQSALTLVSQVANVTFTQLPDGTPAQVNFGTNVSTSGAYTTGGQYSNGSGYANVELNNSDASQIVPNEFIYVALHEMGNVLNLVDTGQENPFNFPASLNNTNYTVMAYGPSPLHATIPNATDNINFAPVTMMTLDVAALQYFYGANQNGYTIPTSAFGTSTSLTGGVLTYKFTNSSNVESIWVGSNVARVTVFDFSACTPDIIVDTGNIVINLNQGAYCSTGTAPASGPDASIYVNGVAYFVPNTPWQNVGIDYGTVIQVGIANNQNATLIADAVTGHNNVLVGGSGNNSFAAGGGVDIFIGGSGTNSTAFHDAAADYSIASLGKGALLVTDNASNATDGTVLLDGAITVLQFADKTVSEAASSLASTVVKGPASIIAANFDSLDALVADGHVTSILLTDGGTPTLSLSGAQYSADSQALADISGAYNVAIVSTVASVANDLALTGIHQVQITDSASAVSAALDALEVYAGAARITSIALTDAAPLITATPTQVTADKAVLSDLSAPYGYILAIDASAPNLTVTGVTGESNVAVFTGKIGQYAIAEPAGGALTVTDTSTGRTSIDTLSGIEQLQFTDQTLTIEKNTSGGEYAALIYQAALNRNPDPLGLNYWAGLTANESYLQITAGFTNSAEFAAKYGALSDSQFVTQLYANVLDRQPDAAGLAFYIAGLAAGWSREEVLDGFAFSPEAIGNATHGYTGQSGAHAAWLMLL